MGERAWHRSQRWCVGTDAVAAVAEGGERLCEVELGLAARPCETRRETRPRDHGLVSQAWSRETFETRFAWYLRT